MILNLNLTFDGKGYHVEIYQQNRVVECTIDYI